MARLEPQRRAISILVHAAWNSPESARLFAVEGAADRQAAHAQKVVDVVASAKGNGVSDPLFKGGWRTKRPDGCTQSRREAAWPHKFTF